MSAGASRKFHTGISSTVAKIRSCFWVINLRKLVKSIHHKCIRCKIDNQKVEMQSMGKLPVERLKLNAAWSNTSLDFFRQSTVKGEMNKRAGGKTYNFIYLFCLLNSSSRGRTKLFIQRVFVSTLMIRLVV